MIDRTCLRAALVSLCVYSCIVLSLLLLLYSMIAYYVYQIVSYLCVQGGALGDEPQTQSPNAKVRTRRA